MPGWQVLATIGGGETEGSSPSTGVVGTRVGSHCELSVAVSVKIYSQEMWGVFETYRGGVVALEAHFTAEQG